jgi:hypothetical protein
VPLKKNNNSNSSISTSIKIMTISRDRVDIKIIGIKEEVVIKDEVVVEEGHMINQTTTTSANNGVAISKEEEGEIVVAVEEEGEIEVDMEDHQANLEINSRMVEERDLEEIQLTRI